MKFKSGIKLAIVSFAVVALLFLAGMALLHTPFGRAYILEEARQYLKNELEMDFQAALLDFNLFTGTARLSGVSFKSSRSSLPPFLTVENLSVRIGLGDALRGRFTLREGALSGIAVRLITDERGTSNIPDFSALAREPSQDTRLDGYLISKLEVSNASLLYEDRGRNVRLNLAGWNFTITGQKPGPSHRLRLQAMQPGSLESGGKTVQVRDLQFDTTLSDHTLQVERLELAGDGARVTASGSIPDITVPFLDFEFQGEWTLEEASRFFDLTGDLSGPVALRGTVKGPAGRPEVSAMLAGDALQAYGYRQVNLTANLAWRTDELQLAVGSLSARSPSGSARGSASFDFKGEESLTSLQLELAQVDLLPLTGLAGLPMGIASRASGRMSASWSGTDFAGLEGSSKLLLRASRSQAAPGLLPVSGELSLISGPSGHALSVSGAEILGTGIEGQVRLNRDMKLRGEIRAEAQDLPGVLQRAAVLLGEETGEASAGLPRAGSAILAATLGGTLDSPAALINLQADNLRFGNADTLQISARADLDTSRLALHEGQINWAGHTLRVVGEAGFAGPDPTLKFEAVAEHVPVSSIIKAMGRELPVDGQLGVEIALGGTFQKPAGTIKFTGKDLLAYSEPLGSLYSEATFHEDRLDLRSFELLKPSQDKPGGRLEGSGSWSIGDGSFSFRVEGRDLRFEQMVLPGDLSIAGNVGLSLAGSGTIDLPSLETWIQVDGLRLQEREFGALSLDAKLQGESVQLGALLPRLNLTATARVGTAAPHAAEIEITADNSDLSALQIKSTSGNLVEGRLTGAFRASGNIDEWKSGEASMHIRDLLLLQEDLEVRNQGLVAIGYSNGSVSVQPATLVAGEARLELAGSLPLLESAPPSTMEIRGETDLGILAAMLPAAEIPEMKGRLKLDARIEGAGGRLRPTAELQLTDGFLDSPQVGAPIGGIAARLRLDGGAIRIEQARAEWAGGKFRASGEVPLGLFPALEPFGLEQKEGPAVFSMELSGLQLESLPMLPEQLKGEASVRVEGEAASSDPASLAGKITFDTLRLRAGTYELRQETPSMISFGEGVASVERFVLTGPKSRIEATGTVGFTGDVPLNLKAMGTADAGILTFMLEDLRAAGDSTFQIAVGGTAAAPEITGYFEAAKAQLALSTPRLQADNLDVRLNLSTSGAILERFSGNLNGGTITAEGEIEYSPAGLGRVDITASTTSVFLNFPPGLRSSLDGSIGLRSRDDFLIVWGSLHFLEGVYTDPLDLEGELIRFLRSGQPQTFEEEQSAFLSKIRYNVLIDTDNPLLVDNNLAKLGMNANLRLSGTWYRPVLLGRISLEEGGEIRLRERDYLVDRGVVDFANQVRIEPSLDILARTKAEGKDIELQISGTIEDLKTSLSSPSDPDLSEPDIISLLLTGRTLDDFRGAELNVATQQAMSYFAGRASGSLSRGAEQALGLSRVRIEPNLIAAESDPGAKLTIGQDITRDLQLVYSMDLANSQNQIWIADYRLTPRFEVRGVKQEDNTYRFEVRHDVRIGGTRPGERKPGEKAQPARKVGSFAFSGNPILGDEEILGKLRIKPGDKYDFFKLQDGMSRLERHYLGQGHLEARLRTERTTANGTIDLILHIEPGPVVDFVFEGGHVPPGARAIAAKAWEEGVFDAQRGEIAVLQIRRQLVNDRYLEARVRYSLEEPSSDRRRVIFQIDPGPRYSAVDLVFEGASGVSPSLLRDALQRAGLLADVYAQPEAVTEFLASLYRDRGYLDASIDRPVPHLDPASGTGRVVIPLREGPLYRIESVHLQGNASQPETDLRELLRPILDQPYRPEVLNRSIGYLQDFYWRRGFNDIAIDYRLQKNTAAGTLRIHFEITENLQEVVQDIVIEGCERSSSAFARSRLEISAGDILNYDLINRSRKSLYDTGAYSLVDLEVVKLPPPTSPAAAGATRQPVQLRVKLREVKPYLLRYGGFYDTERGPGAVVEAASRNFLGGARVLGMRARYDSEFQEIRGYFSQPTMLSFPLKTNLTVFSQRTVFPTFFDDSTGFSLQQEARFGNKFILSYGYRYQRAHTFDKDPDPIFPFDITIPLARISGSLIREDRDDLLDASRGSFTSHAVEYASAFLGSDLRFMRYFGQYFKYFPLAGPSEIPLSGGVRKSRLVYALGLRTGLARAFEGQSLLRSERFFAGGGTTLRGFEQQGVGPRDFFGDPTGGEAVFMANQELRFPVFGIIDGVGFLDLGNVYARASDFNPFDVRKSAGLGLRVRTPFLLLRLDYGFKLDRKPGENRGAFFFSIGQAF